MNFTENQKRYKNELQSSFLTFFKTQDVKHIAAQKLKETKWTLGESVHEYDRRFKDILSQIPYTIDEKLLIQRFIIELLHKIRSPLWMYEILTYEEDLRKYKRIESDDDWNTSSADRRLEERIDMMQKNICDLYLRNAYL